MAQSSSAGVYGQIHTCTSNVNKHIQVPLLGNDQVMFGSCYTHNVKPVNNCNSFGDCD